MNSGIYTTVECLEYLISEIANAANPVQLKNDTEIVAEIVTKLGMFDQNQIQNLLRLKMHCTDVGFENRDISDFRKEVAAIIEPFCDDEASAILDCLRKSQSLRDEDICTTYGSTELGNAGSLPKLLSRMRHRDRMIPLSKNKPISAYRAFHLAEMDTRSTYKTPRLVPRDELQKYMSDDVFSGPQNHELLIIFDLDRRTIILCNSSGGPVKAAIQVEQLLKDYGCSQSENGISPPRDNIESRILYAEDTIWDDSLDLIKGKAFNLQECNTRIVDMKANIQILYNAFPNGGIYSESSKLPRCINSWYISIFATGFMTISSMEEKLRQAGPVESFPVLVHLILRYHRLNNTQRKQELIREHADQVWCALEAHCRNSRYEELDHLLEWNEMVYKSGCLEKSDIVRWESRMEGKLEKMKTEDIDDCYTVSLLGFVDLCEEIIQGNPQSWLTKGSSMR